MINNFTKWLLFSAIITLIPLAARFFLALDVEKGFSSAYFWSSIIISGDPQLISIALLANGIGDILAKEYLQTRIRMILVGIALILLIIITIWYGMISSSVTPNSAPINPHHTVLYMTGVMVVGCFVISSVYVLVGSS